MAKTIKTASPKAKKKDTVRKSAKLTDAEIVEEYMSKLKHPLKNEMEAIRTIIKNANRKISERIKWNAPSYYYVQDIVTFGPPRPERIILVFHHPAIVKIKSKILEGDYKDRRLAQFRDMNDIDSNKKELERIINELVKSIDAKI